MSRNIKLNDKSFAGPSCRILGFVKTVGGDANDVKCLDFVGNALNEMDGVWA